MAKLSTVVLKAVISVIPRGAKEKAMLEEDLCRMGCHGLMEQLWCLKYEMIVAELLVDQDNGWAGTVCQDTDKWTAVAWCKVYYFPIWGERMATWTEKYVEGKFSNPVSSKDRYSIPDCKNVRARQVLEFKVPILYPKKPTRVAITIDNTIFGGLSEEREVDWALVVWDTVKRLSPALGESKASFFYSYVFHLYITHDAIIPKDKKVYMVGKSKLKYNVELDEEEKPTGVDDFE